MIVTFKKFETCEEQRDYTANRLLKSRNNLTKLAGRLALAAPLPPYINGEPSDTYSDGIKVVTTWSFVGNMLSASDENERLIRQASTIVEVGKRAGQLSVSALFDERDGEDNKKLHFYKSAPGKARIADSAGLSNKKEMNVFIESFVDEMEFNVLRYDIPLSAQMDQARLDYAHNEYSDDLEYLERLDAFYKGHIENSIKAYQKKFGICEPDDPKI